MKKILLLSLAFPLSAWASEFPSELEKKISLSYELHTFSLPISEDFFEQKTSYLMNGKEVLPEKKEYCLFDGEEEAQEYERENADWELSRKEIDAFLEEYIVPKIDRQLEAVTISRDDNGEVVFDGFAMKGRQVDKEMTYELIKKAIYHDNDYLRLPVIETDPVVKVTNTDLKEKGIKDLLGVGVSNFSNSSSNRIHNITVAASKLNGTIIAPGEEMSFNDTLGPVDGSTGYRKELVILGNKVDEEYGGGVCQVSSTMFRSILLSGLPITERHFHSFAVSHYEPWGTDATIYIGGKNLKFVNDTVASILIQSSIDYDKHELRFHFYGTKDDRQVSMLGPSIWGWRSPLAAKYETSEKLSPGEKEVLSSPVAGFNAQWTRAISFVDQEKNDIYTFSSEYQPRGLWVVTGVEPSASPTEGENTSEAEVMIQEG